MKCVVCHGENIEVREVRDPIDLGLDVLYVDVTTPVCQTCGECYYDRTTIRYLEMVEADVRAGRASVREIGKVLVYG